MTENLAEQMHIARDHTINHLAIVVMDLTEIHTLNVWKKNLRPDQNVPLIPNVLHSWLVLINIAKIHVFELTYAVEIKLVLF